MTPKPLRISSAKIRSHRLRVNNLAEKLPAGSFAKAAFAGIQDSAPRAALVSLHARVENVGSGDWEHPDLTQTWAPRGAVFVVPAGDLGVFARGIVPRDAERGKELERAVHVARNVVEQGGDSRNVDEALSQDRVGVSNRLIVAAAGLPIRWDARTTQILQASPPSIDDEDARQELARRYLKSLGPGSDLGFAKWAAIDRSDALESLMALRARGEVTEVASDFGAGWILESEVEVLRSAEPVKSVRLIPFGADPVLQVGDDVVGALRPDKGRSRLITRGRGFRLPKWAVGGAVLVDEKLVAAWGRQQGRVTIMALTSVPASKREEIEEEASKLPIPGVETISIGWRNR